MNKFTQHIPAFVDYRDAPPSFEFSTTEELLSNEIVKRYASGPKFSHFALAKNTLIKVSDSGFHWWVVGFIKEPSKVDLPQWEGWKFRARMSDGSTKVLRSEVVSACGDELTLHDGTKALKLH